MIGTIQPQTLRSPSPAYAAHAPQPEGVGDFAQFLKTALDPQAAPVPQTQQEAHRKQLKEAAHQMEVQMMTMMLQTMEKSASEEGLLGDKDTAGLSHFKDMFFQQVAEEIISREGLGFADSLLNTYETKNLNG